MEKKTYLSRNLNAFGERAELDAEAKKIVADKGVLSRILQGNVIELAEYGLHRAVFYCCRMISAQKDTEFVGDDYDGIKKVYSIWLCLNAPQMEADTITSYSLTPKNIIGNTDSTRHRYDLLNVTMIGLNETSYQKKVTDLHGYLGTIFSGRLSSSDKIRILDEEYGVKPTKEMKEGLNKMGSLADLYEEQGIRQGIEQGIERATKVKYTP